MLGHVVLLPKVASAPPRPTSLRKPEGLDKSNAQDLALELLESDNVLVVGGLSVVGESLEKIGVVSLLGMHHNRLQGWALTIPDKERASPMFTYVYEPITPLTAYHIPNYQLRFVGKADAGLNLPMGSQDEIDAIAHFVIPFLSDNGPPKDIDW